MHCHRRCICTATGSPWTTRSSAAWASCGCVSKRGRPRDSSRQTCRRSIVRCALPCCGASAKRSEEHTSELQSRSDLVCRLLLEKKKLSARDPTHASDSSCQCRPGIELLSIAAVIGWLRSDLYCIMKLFCS